MKLEKSKNAKRNILYAIPYKMLMIIFPFVIRTIIIRKLGANYIGVDSLFTSILQVLSLSELGLSSAVVYAMYEPIAHDDMEKLCNILNFYRKVYTFIGAFILFIGVGLMPVLHLLIHSEWPENVNIYILYIIYLLNTSVSYILFAYKNALIIAYQRDDIISKINTIIKLVMYAAQIAVLLVVHNYYIYTGCILMSTIAINVLTEYSSKKIFPKLMPRGSLEIGVKKIIINKIKGIFIGKLCVVTRNSFDSIFISAFFGLLATSRYNNYFYVITGVNALLGIITGSVLGGVGNSIETESIEKNYSDMTCMNFVYMWISGVSTACLLCLYQPFITIAWGPEMLFSDRMMQMFCLYFYSLRLGDIRAIYSEAKGLWWENRYRSMAEAIVNILLNYILGRLLGIYGIISATLISIICINFFWGSNIIFKYYFKSISIREYFMLNGLYAAATIIIVSITYKVCAFVTFKGVGEIACKLLICLILPNILYFAVYRNTNIYARAMPWIIRKLSLPRKIGNVLLK